MLSDADFDPKDWTDWMTNMHRIIKTGGTWAIPGPPPSILIKTARGWRVQLGDPGERTRAVCEAAGLEIT